VVRGASIDDDALGWVAADDQNPPRARLAALALTRGSDPDAVQQVFLRWRVSLRPGAEGTARRIGGAARHAALGVVVDQAHGLQEGVHGGRADEAEAALLQRFRQLDRGGRGRHALVRGLLAGPWLVAPDPRRQRAFVTHQVLRAARVVQHALDLAAVAHDAGVLQQAVDLGRAPAGQHVDVEAGEGAAKVLALFQDGPPAQAGLKALQAQLLEQAPVVGDGKAPFAVVVGQVLRRGQAPVAAQLAVGAGGGAHARSFVLLKQ
jgi:hypothetical protein